MVSSWSTDLQNAFNYFVFVHCFILVYGFCQAVRACYYNHLIRFTIAQWFGGKVCNVFRRVPWKFFENDCFFAEVNVIIVVWISLGHILMLTVLESNFKLCLRLRLTEKSQKLWKEPKLVGDTDMISSFLEAQKITDVTWIHWFDNVDYREDIVVSSFSCDEGTTNTVDL